MSQAKVEQYKKEKANRKKIVAQERMKRKLTKVAVWAVFGVVVAWAGVSGYMIYENSRPVQNYVIDTTPISDYLESLDAE